MMPLPWAIAALCVGAVGSLIFSTLTFSLRDLSRARLADYLERHGRAHLLDPIVDHLSDLIFVTAVCRLLANTLVVLASVWICQQTISRMAIRDPVIFLLAAVVTLFFSVTFPHAITHYAGNAIVGATAGALLALRVAMLPLVWVMHLSDAFVRSVAGVNVIQEPEQIQQQVEDEILSAVEEGEERGVVDEHEREMIESVIEFHDSAVSQVMTARADMVAIEVHTTLEQVRQTIVESGHSRIPVFEGTLDQIVGILYARDLLQFVGQPPEAFQVRAAMRPAFFIPKTTPLGDLLRDFRRRQVHLAIVLDEYGGTAGLVTFEDILELLVGNITDEHEKPDASVFQRTNENTFEADARIEISELNRLAHLNLPEEETYATLGGYVLATLGQIPEKGAVFEQDGLRITVLDAEPQRINRLRIEKLPEPAEVSAERGNDAAG
jgi:CBS domain containing-hemolysin-like protein